MESLSYEKILSCYGIIKPFIHRTPVFTSKFFDESTGRKIFFKCENFQKTGSFKARGALNAVYQLKTRNPECKGVITHSSGNHGAALAYAAKMFQLPCTVVCPSNAPTPKVNTMQGYSARVVFCEPTMVARKNTCEELIEKTGFVLVDPHNDYDIMAGQGTVALELFDQVKELDAIVVPVGGGGMLGGIAAFAKHQKQSCKIFAVEPKGKDLEQCLRAGKALWSDPPQTLDTIADGIRVQRLGPLCFPVVQKLCEHDVFTVGDDEIVAGMRFVYDRLKTVIEPTSGAGVAAVLSEKFKTLDPSVVNVAVILCGGNVDLDKLPW